MSLPYLRPFLKFDTDSVQNIKNLNMTSVTFNGRLIGYSTSTQTRGEALVGAVAASVTLNRIVIDGFTFVSGAKLTYFVTPSLIASNLFIRNCFMGSSNAQNMPFVMEYLSNTQTSTIKFTNINMYNVTGIGYAFSLKTEVSGTIPKVNFYIATDAEKKSVPILTATFDVSS
jgi:hypothetical protein